MSGESGIRWKKATARAHSNIALVKYWGKREAVPKGLNLPATGSLSMTLDRLHTTTSVAFRDGGPDEVWLGGTPAPGPAAERVSRFLDLVREQAGVSGSAVVRSWNNFPTASGLASSASAFAALALAACAAAGLEVSREGSSRLARMGSGSAARSIFGGFVEMLPGSRPDGSDCYARPLFGPDYWDLRLLVAQTTSRKKEVSSSEAMRRTARTSPFYPSWIRLVARDIREAREAIGRRDLDRLGPLVERNALAMHATALAADPPVLFWSPATVEILKLVEGLRKQGMRAYCTIDAGPHVKVLCQGEAAPEMARHLEACPAVQRLTECRPGPGAHLLPEQGLSGSCEGVGESGSSTDL